MIDWVTVGLLVASLVLHVLTLLWLQRVSAQVAVLTVTLHNLGDLMIALDRDLRKMAEEGE